MRKTIELYKELQMAEDDDKDSEEDGFLSETDTSWMYDEPAAEFNCNLILASSPITSPHGSDMDNDHDSDDA